MQDVDYIFDVVFDLINGKNSTLSIAMLESCDNFDPNALIMCENYGSRLLLFAILSRKVGVVKALLNNKKIDLSLPLDYVIDPKEIQKYYKFKHVGEFESKSKELELPNPPLYYALFCGTAEIIKLFVQKGCNIHDKFETRVSGKANALLVVCQSRIFGSINSKVNAVIKLGFKFHKVPRNTIAMTLLLGFFPDNDQICSSFNIKIAYAFINSKIPINTHFENDDGRTPFMLAIAAGNFKVAKLLQERGANIYAIDRYGRTAIYFVVEFDDSKILFLNKKHGREEDDEEEEEEEEIDPEMMIKYLDTFGMSDEGFHLTMKARWKKDPNMINYLIMSDTKFLLMFHDNGHEYIKSGLVYGPKGKERFDYLLFFQYYEMLKFSLIPVDYWVQVLEVIISRNMSFAIFKQVELILREKLTSPLFAKLKGFAKDLLHTAVTCPNISFAEFLIERWGADVNYIKNHRSVLMTAINGVTKFKHCPYMMINLLISKGAKVNYENEHGKCIHQPELGARTWSSYRFLELLHKAGMNLKERSGKSGKTLIGIVREVEDKDCLVELLRIYCGLNILNINTACVDGKVPITFYLLAHPVEYSKIPIFNHSLVDSDGNCFLHHIMKNRRDFKNTRDLLRDNMRKIFNWKNNSNETPLMIAIKRKEENEVPLYEICTAAILSNETFMFEELLSELEEAEEGICRNFIMPRFGTGLLIYLASKKRLGYCRMLVEEYKVDVRCYWASSTSNEILSPTIFAVKSKPILDLFIRNGGSFHEFLVHNQTMLEMHLNEPDLVNNLLDNGYEFERELKKIFGIIISHQVGNLNYIDQNTKDYALPSIKEGYMAFISHPRVWRLIGKQRLSSLLTFNAHSEEKRKLIELGADPLAIVEPNGHTALHFAALKGLSVPNWQLFREYGVTAANICEVKNLDGVSTLDICKAGGLTENLFTAYPSLRSLIKYQPVKYESLSSSETVGDFKTCGICREDYKKTDDIALLKCKHILHLPCLLHLNSENFSSCPYCRHTKYKV